MLSHQVSFMTGDNSDRLVKLTVASDEVEANVLRNALEQEGISVFVKNVDPLGSISAAPTPAFSFELFISTRDERRARWVLGQLEPQTQ